MYWLEKFTKLPSKVWPQGTKTKKEKQRKTFRQTQPLTQGGKQNSNGLKNTRKKKLPEKKGNRGLSPKKDKRAHCEEIKRFRNGLKKKRKKREIMWVQQCSSYQFL